MSTPDLAQAQRFLSALDPAAAVWSFQTFDDKGDDGRLARILHGTLADHATELTRLSQAGAGVFVTINQTDGRGRKTENLVRVRAVFVDLDGSPLEPCLARRCPPHAVVESSPGRWHVYWRVAGMPLADFGAVQKSLIDLFKSDPSVHDLPRVMRLPGFVHQKAEAFLVRIELINDGPPIRAKAFERATQDVRTPSSVDFDMMDAGALAFFLEGLDPTAFRNHHEWFGLMAACHRVTGGEGTDAFAAWSARDPLYASHSRTVRNRWRSLGRRRDGYGAATIIWHLHNTGRDDLADALGRLLSDREDEAAAEFQARPDPEDAS